MTEVDLTICHRCGKKMETRPWDRKTTPQLGLQKEGIEVLLDDHIEQFHKEEFERYASERKQKNDQM